jgi:hypothetical protein
LTKLSLIAFALQCAASMPSIELKSARNRKRGRSRLHLSSTAHSPTSPVSPVTPTDTKNGTVTSLQPTTLNTTTTATTTGSSSSDERQEKSPSASSISSSSFFDDEHWRRVIRKREQNGLKDTVQWGYFLLVTTWVVFVLGIGGVCGVWEWSLKSIRIDTKNRIVLLDCP